MDTEKYLHIKEMDGLLMVLMTKKIEKELLAHLYNEEIQPGDRKVIFMYFNPLNYAQQWHIVSGEKLPNGDWELSGLIHSDDWEWDMLI